MTRLHDFVSVFLQACHIHFATLGKLSLIFDEVGAVLYTVDLMATRRQLQYDNAFYDLSTQITNKTCKFNVDVDLVLYSLLWCSLSWFAGDIHIRRSLVVGRLVVFCRSRRISFSTLHFTQVESKDLLLTDCDTTKFRKSTSDNWISQQ